MSTTPDPRFDEAEAETDRGRSWKFREPGVPNPLTIIATQWTTGTTKLGEAEWLNGTDRSGERWSVLVGSAILRKRLIEGLVEEWDNDRNEFVVIDTLGKVRAGEVVSIKYLGDKQGATYTYPNFVITRKPALEPEPAASAQLGSDQDIPF
jgi:hypothetical protein